MMKKCEVCGRETNRTYSLNGYRTLCSKHMHQVHKYGHPLDNNPRTNNDLNDYVISGDIAIFYVYNQKNEKIDEFIIDLEDIEKVKYRKWRKTHSHIVTGQPSKGEQRELSHIILDLTSGQTQDDIVVDHINGNPNDNRKKNLRLCKQSQNLLNKSFMSNNTSGFIGVSYRKHRGVYDPEIRINSTRCHLGHTHSLEEAVYKRLHAEKLLFKEFISHEEQRKKEDFTKNISLDKKIELQQIVENKLRSKKLWQ